MNSMMLFLFAVIAGFVLLVWGANRFVTGASATARNLGVSPLIIGLTIVGFGTSAPEMLIAGIASWEGAPGIAIGNALGSNISNIALVLGTTALITPLVVHSDTMKREFPILLIIMLLTLLLLSDGQLGHWDGVLLILGMGIMIFWVVNLGLRTRRTDPIQKEFSEEIPEKMPMKIAIMWLLMGLVILLVSSRIVVWGATGIATAFGISDLIIGLTIIAIGTSLPELAASIVSAMKGEHDIAIGNIIGSNMFNLLGVLALPGLIHPSLVEDVVLTRDFTVMILLTIALYAMSYGFGNSKGRITRFEGATLLSAFVGYLVYLYFSAVH